MALDQTTRLGIYTWSSPSDPFTRQQMTDSHELLEELVALFTEGSTGSIPAADATNAQSFYRATDSNVVYYSTGSGGAWFPLNQYATPTALTPGASNSAGDGSVYTISRSDHVHALPAYGATIDLSDVGTSKAAGSVDKFARADHVHILAGGAVTAGKISLGGISASNQFASQVVDSAAIKDNNVTKAKISVDQQIPSGSIMMFGGVDLPVGWLWCNGASHETALYPELASALGSRYGASGLNFTVPDLRDRFPRGGTTTSASVVSAGSDSVTVTSTNLPTHQHAVSITTSEHAGHTHNHAGTGAQAVATTVAHSHTISHSHTASLSNNYVGQGGALGTGLGAVNDGGTPLIVGYGPYGYVMVQNFPAAVIYPGVGVSGTDTPRSGSENINHGHSLSGLTVSDGAHTHTVSGNTGNGPGSGTALDIRPKSLSVNYIIKI